MVKYFFINFALLMLFTGCNDIVSYSAGNRVTLDYEIKTKMSLEIVKDYMYNKIGTMKEYKVPDKWKSHDKLVDIDSSNSMRIYFKNNPEEMYLIQFNGVLLLADVYNEAIIQNGWVAEREFMSSSEEARVKRRFKEEILDKIEMMAKKDGISDSLLYYKPFPPESYK